MKVLKNVSEITAGRVFQYQGEKSESQSFEERFGDHFGVLQYQGEPGH